MSIILFLATGLALSGVPATYETIPYCRATLAQEFSESVQFESSIFAKRNPEAEKEFANAARELALDTALRLLPATEDLDLSYHPHSVRISPLKLKHVDDVLAEHRIQIQCLQLLAQLLHAKDAPDARGGKVWTHRYGAARELDEVPEFVEAYFDHVLDALAHLVAPVEEPGVYSARFDPARAWVVANLDSPLPEDAHTRLTVEDFDRVVEELRAGLQSTRESEPRIKALNPGVDMDEVRERHTKGFLNTAQFYVGRRYLELAWEAGLVTHLPVDAIEQRLLELSDDQEISRRVQWHLNREIAEHQGFPEEQRRSAREQMRRLEAKRAGE